MANGFENEFFTEEDRSAMGFVLGQCIKNATNEQLQDILTAALEIAPIPEAEDVDKGRIQELASLCTKAADALYCPDDPEMLDIYQFFVWSYNEALSTAYQTGDLTDLEECTNTATAILCAAMNPEFCKIINNEDGD